MARHSSVSTREEESTRYSPKTKNSTWAGEDACGPRTEAPLKSRRIDASRKPQRVDASRKPQSINADLKRRARLLISNGSIPPQTRSLIRYALEIRDPYLAQVVRRVEAGEMSIEWLLEE
jgi:hypothetical protein